tara:strand:- start:121 stop:378 length:258 start_codon:yes stop_codon:yes gene_type:complete
MKVGDLVKYRPSGKKPFGKAALGIIVEVSSWNNYNIEKIGTDAHARIRVMWIGEKLPLQAKALSVNGERITTWCRPTSFVVVSEC